MTEPLATCRPDWLSAFCVPADHRELLHRPYTIHWRGIPYAIATDGHRLCAVPGDYGYPPAPRADHILRVLDAEPSGAPVPISLIALKRFCGAPENQGSCAACQDRGRVECPECGGEEQECECHCGHVHEVECRRCHGRGDIQCPDCKGDFSRVMPGLIGHEYYDRSLLARTLLVLAGDHATWQEATGVYRHAVLHTPAWTLIVAALREEGGWNDVPVFDLSAPRSPTGQEVA